MTLELRVWGKYGCWGQGYSSRYVLVRAYPHVIMP